MEKDVAELKRMFQLIIVKLDEVRLKNGLSRTVDEQLHQINARANDRRPAA